MKNQWLTNMLIKVLFNGDRDFIYQIMDNHILGKEINEIENRIYSSLEKIQELKINTAFRTGFDLANILFDQDQYFNSFNPNNPKIVEFSSIIKNSSNINSKTKNEGDL